MAFDGERPVRVQGSEATHLGQKEAALRRILREMDSCVVAFSGGVDSSYLSLVAHQVLADKALIVTAESPSYPAEQKRVALSLARRYAFRHEVIPSAEMEDPNYVKNPSNRCYFCKRELYAKLRSIADSRGFRCVADGNNLDDTTDYRPGREAGRELGVCSPLIEARLGKDEIRQLSRVHDLPTWDRPASACLSSRIPYGSTVTAEKLEMIERGEELLRSLGFRVCRVRHHGDLARIEIGRDELPGAMNLEMFDTLTAAFQGIGFKFVTLDLRGYRTGALNESLVHILPLHSK